VWRQIPLIKASGQMQMAIDSWLLQQHLLGNHPPTLRFYTWSPPAISLGFHQYNYPEYWRNITWQGEKLDLVRRPTGGRAVLHQGDLTYSVVISGLKGNRIEAYQQICEFLLQGFSSLGVDLDYGNAGRGYIHNPNCFGTATGADLVTVNGAKLIGSAQLRKGSVILQHGSIRLNQDKNLFTEIFGVDTQDVNLGNLGELGEDSIPVVIDALVTAARKCFGIEIEERSLSDGEWEECLKMTR
jgi:lipoate---protein ligase